MSANFMEQLNKNATEIERPPLPPQGSYTMSVQGPGQTTERSGFDIVEFTLKGQEAHEDVDEEALAEFGSVNNVVSRVSFLFPQDDEAAAAQTLFRMKTFLVDHLGQEEDAPVSQLIAEAAGHSCTASIIHKQDKNDPNLYHANVKNTAPVAS